MTSSRNRSREGLRHPPYLSEFRFRMRSRAQMDRTSIISHPRLFPVPSLCLEFLRSTEHRVPLPFPSLASSSSTYRVLTLLITVQKSGQIRAAAGSLLQAASEWEKLATGEIYGGPPHCCCFLLDESVNIPSTYLWHSCLPPADLFGPTPQMAFHPPYLSVISNRPGTGLAGNFSASCIAREGCLSV